MKLSVILSPPEIDRLPACDLTSTTCVVFDVLRATSTMLAAFDAGATSIKPVAEISEALAEKRWNPGVLLAGERDGVRIGGQLTGGIEFDFGNSPREMTEEKVRGRHLVSTTTNGTRAIRACSHAAHVSIASFTNLAASAAWLMELNPEQLVLVCSGTGDVSCLEDTSGAGALIQRLIGHVRNIQLADSAIMAHYVYQQVAGELHEKVGAATNAKRLLGMPALADDVAWCLESDRFAGVPTLNSLGYLSC
jgi:2-phosphosulfolactate phosphatase